jgi:hydroxymethylbilane synthase
LRPDLQIRGIRGNVGTRVQKQRDGQYDAVVLAMAGLTRLEQVDVVDQALDVAHMVPACGQGALAIQARKGDAEVLSLLEALHHEKTAVCVAAERAFLEAVSGGCSAPAACHAWLEGEWLVAEAVWAADEGSEARRLRSRSDFLHAIPLGRDLARRLVEGKGQPIAPRK